MPCAPALPAAAAPTAGRTRRGPAAGRARRVAAFALRPGLARLRGAVGAARVAAAILPFELPFVLALVAALARGAVAAFLSPFGAVADLWLGLACVLSRLLAFVLALLARILALGSLHPRRRHLCFH